MNDHNPSAQSDHRTPRAIEIVNRSLPGRYRAERRFRLYGLSAIIASLLFLAFLFVSIIGNGYSAFQQTYLKLDIFFDPAVLGEGALTTADYPGLVK
jgi:phosphate transport system permease protein